MAIANPHALTTVIAGQVSDVLVAVVSESVLRQEAAQRGITATPKANVLSHNAGIVMSATMMSIVDTVNVSKNYARGTVTVNLATDALPTC